MGFVKGIFFLFEHPSIKKAFFPKISHFVTVELLALGFIAQFLFLLFYYSVSIITVFLANILLYFIP